MDEIPLGGNVSASVRVGETVRRRAGPWTPAVHDLLSHLERSNFPAPVPLGLDEQGRAVLAFRAGEVHPGWPDPLPDWMFTDESTLVAAAKLLRRYHECLAGYVPPVDAAWREVAPVEHEIICHNDWSPSNALFRGHEPIAMLDWDGAGPGSRAWDVAISAYWWVPLHSMHGHLDLPSKAVRFKLFCAAYDEKIDGREVFDLLPDLLRFSADYIQHEADAGDPGFTKLASWNVPDRLRREADLLSLRRDQLIVP